MIELPATVWAAMKRGALGKCPRCGDAHLFARFLKAMPCCPSCGQDWSRHRADDFPAYVAILLTGHLLAPIMIELAFVDSLPLWAKMVLVVALALALMLGMLQPAKGAIIAAQWWLGLHDFRPAGRDEAAAAGGG